MVNAICTVSAQPHNEARNIVISARPGQDVELTCSLGKTTDNTQIIGWLVDHTGPYGVNSLLSGVLDGYSASVNTTSMIILNIMMNDNRNGTEYQCVIIGTMPREESDTVFRLHVAGE